jgi:hypothetical protein
LRLRFWILFGFRCRFALAKRTFAIAGLVQHGFALTTTIGCMSFRAKSGPVVGSTSVGGLHRCRQSRDNLERQRTSR